MKNQEVQRAFGTSPASRSLSGPEQAQNPEPVLWTILNPRWVGENEVLRCHEPREGESGPGLGQSAQHATWKEAPALRLCCSGDAHPQGRVNTRSAPEGERLLELCSVGSSVDLEIKGMRRVQRGCSWIPSLCWSLKEQVCDKWF